MTERAFDRIAAGLNDAIGIVRGDEAPVRLHPPAEPDVNSIRKKTGPSRKISSTVRAACSGLFGKDLNKNADVDRSTESACLH